MNGPFLEFFWYCIIYVALIAFAALDGFDLGVGMLHPLARDDRERRIFLNAIGPVWDGNAVWLVIVSGGLLAGFPIAFATLFSAAYDLMMILLAGIIFRAVAIEFRSKRNSTLWRNTWDYLFFAATLIISATVGFILANLITGLPINSDRIFTGSFSTFLDPYTILFSVTVVFLFAMHGAVYLMLKTEPHTRLYIRRPALILTLFFMVCFALLTVATRFWQPHMMTVFQTYPILLTPAVFDVGFLILIFREIYLDRPGRAFIFSSLNIAILFILCAVGSYPVIIHSTIGSDNHLTIYNASSSPMTLTVLFYIVLIGIPIVLAYSYWLYRTFRGKVILDDHGY